MNRREVSESSLPAIFSCWRYNNPHIRPDRGSCLRWRELRQTMSPYRAVTESNRISRLVVLSKIFFLFRDRYDFPTCPEKLRETRPAPVASATHAALLQPGYRRVQQRSSCDKHHGLFLLRIVFSDRSSCPASPLPGWSAAERSPEPDRPIRYA
jgi:hypothetical protein